MWKAMARSGAWVALDNISAALLAFIFFVVTARLLSAEQFGTAALALSIAQIVQPLIDSLFHDAVVQRQTLTKVDLTTAGTVCFLWSLLLALSLWGTAPAIAAGLSSPDLVYYLPWMGLAFVFAGASAVAAAEARRAMQFRWLAIRTIIGRTVGNAVGLWMAWQGFGVWAVVVQYLVSQALASLLLLAGAQLHLGAISLAKLRPLLAFAAPTVGTQFLLYANSRVITLVIGGAMGPVAAGTWSVAFRFVEPLQAVLATTVGQFCLPLFSRRQDDRDTMAHYFSQGTHYIAILLAPALLGLAVCAEKVVFLFVGEQWLAAVPVMQIVCVVTAILLIRQMAEIVLTARGRPRFTLYTHAVAGLLSIAGVGGGVAFGLLPATAGWTLRVLPFLTLNAYYIRKELGVSLSRQWAEPLGPVAAALVMGIALFMLDAAALETIRPAVALGIMVVTGLGIYSVMLFVIDRQFRNLLRSGVAFVSRQSG